jgi:SAM-dependent methyltransferase
MSVKRCRFCGEPVMYTFADLGVQPLCERYYEPNQLGQMERFYPLHTYVCGRCFLVQLCDSVTPEEIFGKYSYFSSHSAGWLKHAENYADMIIKRLGLDERSQVVEIGSNDGYLVQHFARRGIPVLGIEPAVNVAEEALQKGIPTLIKFFGVDVSKQLVENYGRADLVVGNNVLAQVPDLNGFVQGLKNLLKPCGVLTLEFHHLMSLVNNIQFDTISHERFSYFSFFVVEKVLAAHGLRIFDVEELSTHGGSLRVYACLSENDSMPVHTSVRQLRDREKAEGMAEIGKYLAFAERVKVAKYNILDCMIRIKRNKKSVVGYGAHAEAHTLLNYCGFGTDFLDYIADRNPAKQGRFMSGTHIPILHPDKIKETKPDYVLILAWNIKREIMSQLSCVGEWGGQFVVPLPEVTLYDATGAEIGNANSISEAIL